MRRNLLIASNDIVMRELMAKFFNSCGFVSRCVNCDERLFAQITDASPQVLISEVSLKSRFFSPNDTYSAFSMILAAKCRIPKLPVFVISRECSCALQADVSKLNISGYFEYPLDLAEMLKQLRFEIRRVSRLKNYGSYFNRSGANAAGKSPRGRPRKKTVALPIPEQTAA